MKKRGMGSTQRVAGLQSLLLILSAFLATSVSAQQGPIAGDVLGQFSGGEICMALRKAPGGEYSSKDLQKEAEYCAIDFYQPGIALCAKTNSTSPATRIFDFSQSTVADEERLCAHRRPQDDVENVEQLVKFKMTTNGSLSSRASSRHRYSTSGTYSMASIIYYHFSRYFDTTIKVPVAVYRTISRAEHLRRVVSFGLTQTRRTARDRVSVHNGWQYLNVVENNPELHGEPELFFHQGDREMIFGSLLESPGKGYPSRRKRGAQEFAGRREGGYTGQWRGMLNTAPFRALRSDEDLATAVADAKAGLDTRSHVHDAQMVYWMKEMSEMVILDHLLEQQDRPGNIDFRWYWYYVNEFGDVKNKRAKGVSAWSDADTKVPEELAVFQPVLVKRTHLNDNDAGVLEKYVGHAASRQIQAVDKLRRLSATMYQKVIHLDAELKNESSEWYQYLQSSFGLRERDFDKIRSNVEEVAAILRENCEEGKLRFDLDQPKRFFRDALSTATEITVNCQSGAF